MSFIDRISKWRVGDWAAFMTILGFVAGCAVFITKYYYDAKLAKYETAEELQLDKSLAELRSLSVELKPAIAERKAISQLPAALARAAALEKALNESIARRNVAEAALEATRRTGQTVTIREAESEAFIENTFRVGVSGVSVAGEYCYLTYGNNDEASLKAGGKRSGHDDASNSDFEIKVVSIRENSCTLEFRAWTAAPKGSH